MMLVSFSTKVRQLSVQAMLQVVLGTKPILVSVLLEWGIEPRLLVTEVSLWEMRQKHKAMLPLLLAVIILLSLL